MCKEDSWVEWNRGGGDNGCALRNRGQELETAGLSTGGEMKSADKNRNTWNQLHMSKSGT